MGTALRGLQEHSLCHRPNTSQMMQGVGTSSLGSVESPFDAGGQNTDRSIPLSAVRTNLQRGEEENRPEEQGGLADSACPPRTSWSRGVGWKGTLSRDGVQSV